MLNINNKILGYIEENGEENLLKMIELLESSKIEKGNIDEYLTENIETIINTVVIKTISDSQNETFKIIKGILVEQMENMSNDGNYKQKLEFEKLLNKINIAFNKVETPLNLLTCQMDTVKDSLNYNKNCAVVKGKISEIKLSSILTDLFPSAEIEDNAHKTAQGDIMIKRINKKDLLIENKDYKRNVPKAEIDKFIRDVKNTDCNGIFLSQASGISKKDNYSIEIVDSNIVMYVHFVNYEKEKIKIAIDAIDALSSQFIELSKKEQTTDGIKINKKKLREFQNELSEKKKEKSELIKIIRKDFSNVIKRIESFELPNLEIFEKNSNLKDDESDNNSDIDSDNSEISEDILKR